MINNTNDDRKYLDEKDKTGDVNGQFGEPRGGLHILYDPWTKITD